jgi:ABC-type multidrug transport system permease subunit
LPRLTERALSPIVNASRPALLAGLSLTAIQLAQRSLVLRSALVASTIFYMISSISLFFYDVTPEERSHKQTTFKSWLTFLWHAASVTFFLGLLLTVVSAFLLILV